ncbi:MAG: MurR/RpiR family transcriptional regulator [Lachnospiraceae bacterium]|nr:MurR/RpiR family transcriptional regulator [Lachnospiraceae bacterium]
MKLQFPQSPDRLSQTDSRILEYIEGHREEVMFMSIGQMSAQIEVSEASISRFVRHMGCQDYKQLKSIILEQNHLEGPAGKMAGTLFSGDGFCAARYLNRQHQCLEKTLEQLDDSVFEEAVRAIRNGKRIYIHAKSASASMGELLFFRLRRLGLPVILLPSGGSELLEGLAQAEADDLVIFFAFSKVSWESRTILDCQKEAGFRTLCFTSRLIMPEDDSADINLYVYRGEANEYHSMTAATAMVDALIVAVMEQLGADGAKKLQRLHQMKKDHRIF